MRLSNTTTNTTYSHPGLDGIVKLYQSDAKLFYPSYSRVKTTTNDRDKIGTEGTFPVLTNIGEGDSHPIIDFRNPFTMEITPLKFGGIFSVSSEAMEAEKWGMIGRKATKLLQAEDKTKEYLLADIHNLATNAAFATPDGVAAASASHLYNGGTYSNIVTGTPVLSQVALELAINELMYAQKDDEGDPWGFSGPYNLLVHPAQAGLANRLVKAMKLPTTNNNDPNWAGEFIANVIPVPFFTSTTAWSLLSTGRKNPYILLNRRGVQVKMDDDFSKDGSLVRVNSIFTRYMEDPRGWIYSGS